jgi:hypothetical protein
VCNGFVVRDAGTVEGAQLQWLMIGAWLHGGGALTQGHDGNAKVRGLGVGHLAACVRWEGGISPQLQGERKKPKQR